jgi:hypothetical protein
MVRPVLLAERPQVAIWVTRSRMRRRDRLPSPILADLGEFSIAVLDLEGLLRLRRSNGCLCFELSLKIAAGPSHQRTSRLFTPFKWSNTAPPSTIAPLMGGAVLSQKRLPNAKANERGDYLIVLHLRDGRSLPMLASLEYTCAVVVDCERCSEGHQA